MFWAPMAKAKVKSARDGVENVGRTDEPSLVIRCGGEGLGAWYRSAHCSMVEGRIEDIRERETI
jgi:hypothetical protein